MSSGRPPQKSSRALWIVLGTLGGGFLLLSAICCGGVVWLSRFPSVPASALLPFENAGYVTPAFPTEGTEVGSPLIPDGFVCHEIVLGDGSGFGLPPGSNGRMYVYTPIESDPGTQLPCVLIAPAGSTLMEGMDLGEGDVSEHVPYLEAGFVVVAFSLDGPSSGTAPDAKAYTQFRASRAGLMNAHNAIEYALTQLPQVNPQQIFVAGHSSAGTLAVLFAEHEPRLAGCVAFAPCIDLKARLPVFLIRTLSGTLDGLAEFIVKSSPMTHEAQLQCPIMVFHATDDSNVPVGPSRDFVHRMKAAGKNATLVEVPAGDHYDSMIDEGIPRGIEWMKGIAEIKGNN